MKVSDYDPYHSMVALFKYKMSMSNESKKRLAHRLSVVVVK